MLAHHVFLVLAAFSLVACDHLSRTERSVVGTWRQQEIDGAEYLVLGADHSYAFVAKADENIRRNLLVCEGSWRIEGDELVRDCVATYSPGSIKASRGPERHVERERVAE
jgi:hypothetical protein